MTPTQLAEQYVELSKNSGKTTALINALPNEKCAVMSSSHAANDNIKDKLKELRPDYNLDNVEWLVYSPNSGWRDKTLLRDMHVYLDDSLIGEMSINQIKAINDVYGKEKS
jgi:hypothetical protein